MTVTRSRRSGVDKHFRWTLSGLWENFRPPLCPGKVLQHDMLSKDVDYGNEVEANINS